MMATESMFGNWQMNSLGKISWSCSAARFMLVFVSVPCTCFPDRNVKKNNVFSGTKRANQTNQVAESACILERASAF